jgi:hypothetical protein
MTYKAAVAGINLGGGKSVIVGNNQRTDREVVFRAHGRFIQTLGGRYITSEDIGTSPADMEYIKLETDHVAGLLGLSGDPSPVTAYGVYMGMKAAAKTRWGNDRLTGRTVAVQGCGHVATHLCRHLHAEGVHHPAQAPGRDHCRRGHVVRVVGIIDRFGAVGPEIERLVAECPKLNDQPLLQGEAGMVRSDGNYFGHWL